MQPNAEFTLYTSNCCGNAYNTSYPNRVRITCAEDMKKAAALDHVAALYKTGYAAKDAKREYPIPCHRSNHDYEEANTKLQ